MRAPPPRAPDRAADLEARPRRRLAPSYYRRTVSGIGRTAAELRQIREAIDAETRRRALPLVRERVDRGIENGMRVVRDPRDVRLHPVTVTTGSVRTSVCRTLGCENRANAKYDRGPFSGLCWEACIPVARQEASRRATEAQARRRRNGGRLDAEVEPVVEPAVDPIEPDEPEPEREPEPDPVAPSPWRHEDDVPVPEPEPEPGWDTLADLAAALEDAEEALAAAEDAFATARRRFAAHPLVIAAVSDS